MQKMCSILCWTHGSVSIRGFLSTLNKINNKHDSTYWPAFLSQRGIHGDLHEWMTRNILISNGVSLLLKVVQWLSSLIRINSKLLSLVHKSLPGSLSSRNLSSSYLPLAHCTLSILVSFLLLCFEQTTIPFSSAHSYCCSLYLQHTFLVSQVLIQMMFTWEALLGTVSKTACPDLSMSLPL